jgi:hypothetical protein
MNTRKAKAEEFYYHVMAIITNAKKGVDFHSGIPFVVRDGKTVLGLRVCSIKVNCGLDNNRLLKLLDKSSLPHFIPWKCDLEPTAYQHGRYVVIEAQWPAGYERADIKLNDISTPGVRRSDRLIVGVNAFGTNITIPVHEFSHLLVAGQTGSGKSVTLCQTALQLGAVNDHCQNFIVLLDGKQGEGLGIVSGISPYQIGPLAIRNDDIVDALGWCIDEMNRRYAVIEASGGRSLGPQFKHIYIIFDEFQRLTKKGKNPIVTSQMNLLATQARAAKMHLIACTQKPLQESWGDPHTRDQFDAVFCHRVNDRHASEAAVGGTFPECHTLLPHGDAYIVTHSPYILERVQVAYVPQADLARLQGCKPVLDTWPAFDIAAYTGKANGRPLEPPSPTQFAVGLEAATFGLGRDWYRAQLNGDKPGSGRSDRIISDCVDIVSAMTHRDLQIIRRKK